MSYIALYRKWRPLSFEDVVEQNHVVNTLKNSIKQDRIAHAYLFCGTRGTGKTTMAKIFARAINCTNPQNGNPCNQCETCKGILGGNILDVIEIDAASNNSVDNIREIRDEVVYTPSQAKYKVYIIDEVHMLSTGAFNALLKTLEEPPSHVVFILATTEPHKLPATILSRCQKFEFRRITVESIVERLQEISDKNDVEISAQALKLVAKMSEGALRDAISILDQCMSLGRQEISYDDVLAVVGIVNSEFMAEMVDGIIAKNIDIIFELIDRLVMDGKDIGNFLSDMVSYYRNLLIVKVTGKPEEIIAVSTDELSKLINQANKLEQEQIIYIIKELSQLESAIKWSTQPRILLEVALIKICRQDFSLDKENIIDRLTLLEQKLQKGYFVSNENVKAKEVDELKYEVKQKENRMTKENSNSKSTETKYKGTALKNWNEILNELKNSGRMVVYTNLLDTRAVFLEDNIIGIVFNLGSEFKKMLVSKAQNIEVIESVIEKALGQKVKVKCIDNEDYSEKKEEKTEKDELVEKAKDFAQKFDIPLDIIDE